MVMKNSFLPRRIEPVWLFFCEKAIFDVQRVKSAAASLCPEGTEVPVFINAG